MSRGKISTEIEKRTNGTPLGKTGDDDPNDFAFSIQDNNALMKLNTKHSKAKVSSCTSVACFQGIGDALKFQIHIVESTVLRCAKVILVMAENEKKGVKTKTQTQSYRVFHLEREAYVKVVETHIARFYVTIMKN